MALDEGARTSFEKTQRESSFVLVCSCERAAGSQLCCLLGSWLETLECMANHFCLLLGRACGLADGTKHT